jgi:hypothetical protein
MTSVRGCHGLLKHRSLGDRQAHVEPEDHEHGAGQERDPPPEREELLIGEKVGQHDEGAAREKEAERGAELRKHSVPCAPARWRILRRQQHRAAPLATKPQTLAETTEREQGRGDEADRVVGRKGADGDCRQAHGQERCDQRGLAADAVAEVAEQCRPDRSRQKRDRERRQRSQCRGNRIGRRKEQSREHEHGRGGIDVEVEELDGRADEACKQHLSGAVHDFIGTGGKLLGHGALGISALVLPAITNCRDRGRAAGTLGHRSPDLL